MRTNVVMASINSRKHSKKTRLRERTDRAWFNRLLRHLARKRSGSILTTPEPTLGSGPAKDYKGEPLTVTGDLSEMELTLWNCPPFLTTAKVGYFTGHTSFLLPNQQCQSNEGMQGRWKDETENSPSSCTLRWRPSWASCGSAVLRGS